MQGQLDLSDGDVLTQSIHQLFNTENKEERELIMN